MDLTEEDPEKACSYFFETLDVEPGMIVSGYWPIRREISPLPVMERCLEIGAKCALPIMREGRRVLDFGLWEENMPLREVGYGVKEPVIENEQDLVDPDILVVPLLVFDRRGYRLGYGGGFYDASLQYLRTKKPVLAVGYAYAQQACLFPLPAEDHDEKLDLVMTPHGVHDFRN